MGEHTFYGKGNLQYGKACESAKSNALMRCCKDLGIASELWDPVVRMSMWLSLLIILHVSIVCQQLEKPTCS